MKILLIEDDKYTASMISNALTACYYLIDTTENGQTGLELTKAYSYDLILLDVIVPGLDGVSLCRQLRSQGYQMPILMLTAKNRSGDRRYGFRGRCRRLRRQALRFVRVNRPDSSITATKKSNH